jgi:hypothetical protein
MYIKKKNWAERIKRYVEATGEKQIIINHGFLAAIGFPYGAKQFCKVVIGYIPDYGTMLFYDEEKHRIITIE